MENNVSNANGSAAHSPASNPPAADISSDESSYSTKDENVCLRSAKRRQSHQSGSSVENAKSEDKPSFSSIVDRRNRKGFIPLFFERASGNILNPCFDSDILENEFQRFSLSVDKRRFQIALLYVAFAALVLTIFFAATEHNNHLVIACACTFVITLFIVAITKFARLYVNPVAAITLSVLVSILFTVGEVVSLFTIDESEFTYSARFGIAACIIILIYTMMPALPLYGSLILTVLFSVAHELAAGFKGNINDRDSTDIVFLVILHACVHLLGMTIVFMAQVRRRSTFWRVGQSVVAKQDLDIEQRVKNRMIRSVMPKKVAEFLISNGLKQKRDGSTRQKSVAFRPFAMYKVQNVSILFADIVGFTKMSAKKEADHLVHLLNMLFGKFDELTELNNCEKISTLGDCYYCVAGCPEASHYHAISCIEMGLDIVEQIKKFCQETGEDVDMRVGIHTGNVLCGIVGDKRRRFDVWGNDVALANKMESAGRPGRVHFTAKTLEFLEESYKYEKGDGISRPQNEGGFLETYFIVERANGTGAYKPWQKEPLTAKNSVSSLHDIPFRGQSDSMANVLAGLDPQQKKKLQEAAAADQTLFSEVSSPTHVKMSMMNSNENNSIAKATFTPPTSPVNSSNNLQKQFVKTPLPFPRLSATFKFTYGMTLNEALMRDAMRASNDNQLVRLMHEKKIHKQYFFKPTLHWWSLRFIDEPKKKEKEANSQSDLQEVNKKGDLQNNLKKEEGISTEMKYREEGLKGFRLNPKVTTFASPKVHFFFDILTAVLTLILLIVACCLFLTNNKFPIPFYVVAPTCALLIVLVFISQAIRFSPTAFPSRISECAGPMDRLSDTGSSDVPSMVELNNMHTHNDINMNVPPSRMRAFKEKMLTQWHIIHFIGGIVLCLPIIVVFSMYRTCASNEFEIADVEYFSMFMFVVLLFFCSFTQLSSLMKNALAIIWSIGFIISILTIDSDECFDNRGYCNGTKCNPKRSLQDIAIVALLEIVLVFVLNRIHEQGVRANFYGDKEAAEQKNSAIEQKQVADWLIQDMFPRHVSDQLKYTKNCSKNYELVGVLFATIVNFGEFYEEHFEGGIECIRILHELVADFDKELMKYDNIEKIKTVYGTTFMAASGLKIKPSVSIKSQQQNVTKQHKYIHLKALVDFALGLQNILNEFNKNMLGFRFRLRCGFNAGPVTAGVIGSIKPQYDIWGDTVNLASRMDSLGVRDRIQVDESTMKKLIDFYTFELRGTIPVKGKNDTTTYLLQEKKANIQTVMETVEE